MSHAITMTHLSKTFPWERGRRTAFTTIRDHLIRRQRNDVVKALEDISLRISAGERVAIVGNNGAGKTTLLKTIARLYLPSEGRVDVEGHTVYLAGLGIGMMEELTVTENIFLYGIIYGIERAMIKSQLGEILEWADLDEFKYMKVKTLSSGMKARLAFSVTRHIAAELYLIDEALTAGDKTFVEKCQTCFDGYRSSTRTFVLSTHDLDFARNFCTHALWLHKGKSMAYGEVQSVVSRYSKWRQS